MIISRIKFIQVGILEIYLSEFLYETVKVINISSIIIDDILEPINFFVKAIDIDSK
jgi:hypothetical protein